MDKSRHDISHQRRATNDGILNLLSNLEPKALYLDSWFRRYSMSLKPKLYSNPSAFSTADSAIIKLRNAGVFAWICGIVVDITAPLCRELTNAVPSGFQVRIHNNRHT